MQTIKEKMIPAFRDANGGLFQAVEKADVGSAYQDLEKQGVALMGWADPFMPDRSLPEPVAAAWLDAVRAESAPHYTAPIGRPGTESRTGQKAEAAERFDCGSGAQHPDHARFGLRPVLCDPAFCGSGR